MAQVIILGAGTPTPTPLRFGSSHILHIGNQYLMFDCGPAATHKLVKAGLHPTQVHHLFFTHHHFDHNADYACFALARWDQGAGKIPDLQVIGPERTQKITDLLMGEDGAFSFDWKARVGHPLSQRVYTQRGGVLPRRPPRIQARDVAPGTVLSGGEWEVVAARAEHVQPFLDSLAYRVNFSGGSVVFTGDTRACQSVIDLARGADVMLCMCWDDQERMEAAGLHEGMSGTLDAARMAQEAGVKKLVLVHIGPELSAHGSMEKGISDVKRVYDGELVFAEELLRVPL